MSQKSPLYAEISRQRIRIEELERELRCTRSSLQVYGELVEANQQAEARLYELLRREHVVNEELRKDVADLRSLLLTKEIDAEFQATNEIQEAIHGPNAVA